MNSLNSPGKEKLERIAFHLTTCTNQKARRHLLRKNVTTDQLPRLNRDELAIFGFKPAEIDRIKSDHMQAAEEEVQKANDNGVRFLFKGEADYPPLLAEIYDPPDYLYAAGDVSLLREPKLAIVGSRKGSNYGWQCLKRLLPDACRAGIVIVSGMAYGIDSMAHQITLGENGKTVGVNAGGLLHLYPAGNKGMIDEIKRRGCIVSEFPLDTVPRPFYFPIRNRIIAGVSQAILVVEAAMKSGSLVTARLGLEQNRDILALPGNIDSPISKGTNYLIQQGARLIASPEEILEEFGIQKDALSEKIPDFSKKEQKVLDLMPGNEVKSIDYFVDELDCSVSETISVLMGLILKNGVIEESGGYKRIE